MHLDPEDQLKGLPHVMTSVSKRVTRVRQRNPARSPGRVQPKHPQSPGAKQAKTQVRGPWKARQTTKLDGTEAWCCCMGLHRVGAMPLGRCCEQEPQYCLPSTHKPPSQSARKPEERVTPVAVDTRPGPGNSSSAAAGTVIQSQQRTR